MGVDSLLMIAGESAEALKRQEAAWKEIGSRVASVIAAAAADDSSDWGEPAPLQNLKKPCHPSPALSLRVPSTTAGSRPVSELGDESDDDSLASHYGDESPEPAARLHDVMSQADKWQEVGRRFASVFRDAALEEDSESD
mmetsp:Transcript_47986/g.126713  ORF Transcript_47986/g.126713 Transcript_47986/m.126713 type:complete len:140 (+) Transcript_47986:78-497(+)